MVFRPYVHTMSSTQFLLWGFMIVLQSGIYEAADVPELETKEDFDNFLKDEGSKLVVIEFYADWCGPCKKIKSSFSGMAEKFTDVCFGKVNADENLETGQVEEISTMPTFKFYRDGAEVDKLTGANEAKLKDKIMAFK